MNSVPSFSARVLVGITTRNRAHILAKAIRSALDQTYPLVAVAVLDDGSTDATPELRAQFPQVHWQRNKSPQGIIEARNHLMRSTPAEFFVSLDDDAWFLGRDEIALAVAAMDADARLGAVAFDIASPDQPTERARGAAREVAMFIGCGHLLRMSAVRDAGFYAPTPGRYGSEEKDLSLRLADLGYRIDLLPGVHVWHDKAWTGRDWFPLHRSGVCNELFMTMRRCPWPDLAFVLPLKIVSFGWFWLRRPQFLSPGIAGLCDAILALPKAEISRGPVRRATFWKMSAGRRVT
ncbi:MAG: hypothetical protein C0518_09270 [Opitutus sp.]|nr:hypothetical protein [Opitutus sp.]